MAVAALPLEEIWRSRDTLLRRAVPWDISAWGQVDPATLLSTGCFVVGMAFDEERERAVFELEHDEREIGRLVDLVHRQPPAAGLDVETGGRPERSPRYSSLLRPLGIRDDMRVALVADDGSCWASLYFYRRNDLFRAEEVALVGALAGDLADAVRLALLRADAEAAAHPDAPGLVLLGPDGRLSAMSGLAQQWLSLLAPEGRLPSAVTSLSAALRSSSPGPRTAHVQLVDGRWVALHASHLDGAGGALIVELARPLVVADVLCAAYGLSPRERDVVGLVLRGESNRAAARALGISEHTVKEHLKSVFTKVGVLSRSELAARLLHEHYLPRRNAGLPASAGGWFRETS